MNAIVSALLPTLAGPLVTAAIKWAFAKFGGNLGSLTKIVISAVAGALTAVTTGDTTTLASVATDAVTGAIGGTAGSKARDIVVGKSGACAPATVGDELTPGV